MGERAIHERDIWSELSSRAVQPTEPRVPGWAARDKVLSLTIPSSRTGFFGKIPSRADFVQSGLSHAVVDAWYAWMSHVLAGSRSEMGETWLPAWLEAPVWRFALPAGMCGPDAMLGLWMPSVDRVGRYFPLMVTTIRADDDPRLLASAGSAFLQAAEDAGRVALADDIDPEALALRLPMAVEPGGEIGPFGVEAKRDDGVWWTDGSPRVPAQIVALGRMPDVKRFVTMLDAGDAMPEEAG